MNDYQTQAKQFLSTPQWKSNISARQIQHGMKSCTTATGSPSQLRKENTAASSTTACTIRKSPICLLRIMVVSTIREIRWIQHSTRKTNGEKNRANSRQKRDLMSMMYLLVLRSTATTASVTSVPSSATVPTVSLQGKLSLLVVRNM